MIRTAFGYDGSIRIKADLNHSNFDKGLSFMQGRVDKFSVTLKKLASTVSLAFGTAAIINFGKESVKAASALNDAWMGLESIVTGQGKSFSKAKSFINDYISDGLVPLENAVTAYKNLAARGYDTEQIEKTLTALKDAAAFGRQASYSLGEAVSTATEGLKNENSILVDNAGVTKNVSVMWKEYAQSIGVGVNSLTKAQKIQAEVNGILEETKFQTGDAAKLVNNYSGQIAMLGYNFQQLKVQVGNAIMPIVQAVLPGINAIISALVKLAKVFAQVTALLFGKKSTSISSGQVQEQEAIASSGLAAAGATDKLADATAGAGEASKKAAKDMKGVLAGFDELNILADSAASSVSGAAGGISDIGGTDNLVDSNGEILGDAEINPKISEELYALTKKLKEMIPLIAGIGAGLLAWKIANSLIPDLGTLQGLLGSLLVGVGVTLLVDSIKDIIFGDGLTWENILKGGAGGALAGAGLGLMLAKKLGLTWTQGMLGGAVIGLGVALLVESVADIITRGLNIGNAILGAIGGAIAGAAAGFLYMGGPGGALLGATIGLGVALAIESISDIAVSGLNLANGAIGLIGTALAGAGIGFYMGGPGGAVLGATIGVGLTLAIQNIVSQIAGGLNLFDAIKTVIGTALAGAGIGFSIVGGVGAAAGAVLGLFAGIALEVTGVTIAGKAVYEATEDFQTMTRIIDECESSANRSSAAMENLGRNIEGLNSSMADVGAAQSLVEEIYAINENANASAYELELMASKVDLLNSMGLDGLHLTIDETTGRIVETKEATDQLILSLQKEAETAALQELLVQAYKDRYQAVSDAEQAVKSMDAAEQALKDTEEQLTNTPWWDLEKHAALTEQQKKQTEALEAATDARDNAITAYDELSGAIDTYAGSLTNLSEPEANVGVQLESRMDSVRKTVEGVAADMPGYGRNIGEGLEKGMDEGVDEKKTKGIFGRIGDWFKDLFGIHSPSTVFKEYGNFLMTGLSNGINENLPPIETTLSGFLKDTESKVSTTWSNVETDTSNKWGNIKDGLVGEYASINTESDSGFKAIKGTIVGKIDATMKELLGKDWLSIGKGIVDGVMNGLKSIFEKLRSWASDVWSSITSAFSSKNITPSYSSGRVSVSSGYRMANMIPESYSARNLPRLANGAVIPPNQQFAAILGDQRSGTNLELPEGLLRRAIREEMSGMMTGTDVNISFNGSLSELARVLQPAIKVEERRRGPQLTQ